MIPSSRALKMFSLEWDNPAEGGEGGHFNETTVFRHFKLTATFSHLLDARNLGNIQMNFYSKHSTIS